MLVLLMLALNLTACGSSLTRSRHIERAEELARQNKIDEAVEEYRLHMQQRLDLKNRPEWENPHLYLLLIGDLYLGIAEIEKAQSYYTQAEKNGVDERLISDRIRAMASFYEKIGTLEKAIEILQRERTRDPLLFDAMLDRISKQLVKLEQQKKESQAP
jgi:tetratricopeptide (TPR) repeat protein